MSSSEDEFYGNAAKKLQKLMYNYSEDKIDTAKLLNPTDSTATVIDGSLSTNENIDVSKDSLYEDDAVLDEIISLNSLRQTRSKTNRGAASKRVGVAKSGKVKCKTRDASDGSEVLNVRTRSHSRRRQSLNQNAQNSYPTYSVGNTDDYPDLSNNVTLFNAKPVVREADDLIDENEELSVKVYWRSSDIIKFTIRKFQKIQQIYDFFAERECVAYDKLLFAYNNRILKPDDTPDKIDYNIAKFIDGGLVNSAPVPFDCNDVGNGIKLKFQCENVKRPLVIYVEKDEKLGKAMMKCSEHLDKPLNVLKFVFDGDAISGCMRPEDLDLEGGECIDVKIVG